jgi:NADPH-dependent curcumin reductase CurA
MLWLKARSLIALGITTATLKGSIRASVASGGVSVSAAGGSVGAAVGAGAGWQAAMIIAISTTRLSNLKIRFIFSFLNP